MIWWVIGGVLVLVTAGRVRRWLKEEDRQHDEMKR